MPENRDDGSHLAISVGLKLSCISFCQTDNSESKGQNTDAKDEKRPRIVSKLCSTETLDSTLHSLQENQEIVPNTIFLTGTDSEKWSKNTQITLKTKFHVDQEIMQFIALGCGFVLKNINDEAFQLNLETHPLNFVSNAYKFFPCVLINKNEFIDFIKMSTDKEFQFLGKSCFNLQQMLLISKGLTGTKDLESFMVVLKSSPIYSQITKCSEDTFMKTMAEVEGLIFSENELLEKSHLAWYLFWLWCSNICQLASLHCQNNKTKNVILGEGWDINADYLSILNLIFKYCTGGRLKMIFLRHSAFLSSIGVLLSKLTADFQLSWRENYFLSSGYNREFQSTGQQTLALDSVAAKLVPCPLLIDPSTYNPLLQNLYIDDESREYWIQCIIQNIRSKGNNRLSAESCSPMQIAFYKFQDMAVEKLQHLMQYPYSFGNLSMMILQNMLDDCKYELELFDTYSKVKREEANLAVQIFERHIKFLDRLNFRDRQLEIALSILAGNMFDYGSKEVFELLNSGHFGFKEAIKKLPLRPWLIDNLDAWIEQIEEKPYKLAAVFVDNFGFDLVLGVFPFIRELLKNGTKVLLCANKYPVINDVTSEELDSALKSVSTACSYIEEAYSNKDIKIVEVPNSSCCLDFRYVSEEFAEFCSDVDLLVIEGMGRAIHTNLDAEFNVDCLRMAVIKNHWLSKKLGGIDFSPVFKFSTYVCETHL
ncbi:pantothenate kinase 4-like isoform X2 [Cimex lectularius]|uniref:4'-phosphopantetheine phosphatase n=1 Tax=Cimex lectularius TaxID=79782 RepID=A0A8I6SMU4_CIMLE|nr:pantothenate kinase 4-like isoform X2 [Cimex lectularius]